MINLIQDDPVFRSEVRTILASIPEANYMVMEASIASNFGSAKVTPWRANDNQGTVYGWPEDIGVLVVEDTDDLWVVPTVSYPSHVSSADLAVFLRIVQLYEMMNRFNLGNKRPKLAFWCGSISEDARGIVEKIGVRVLS